MNLKICIVGIGRGELLAITNHGFNHLISWPEPASRAAGLLSALHCCYSKILNDIAWRTFTYVNDQYIVIFFT